MTYTAGVLAPAAQRQGVGRAAAAAASWPRSRSAGDRRTRGERNGRPDNGAGRRVWHEFPRERAFTRARLHVRRFSIKGHQEPRLEVCEKPVRVRRRRQPRVPRPSGRGQAGVRRCEGIGAVLPRGPRQVAQQPRRRHCVSRVTGLWTRTSALVRRDRGRWR